jgi:hypothetical protein
MRLLIVALLAATSWGVVSVRQTRIGFADYRSAATELLEEAPYLIAAGRAVVAGMVRAAVPMTPGEPGASDDAESTTK